MQKTFTFLFFISLTWIAAAQSITTIKGVANEYVGKEIKVFAIEDYLSELRTQIASDVVETDSTFKISFYNSQTRKLRIESDGNFFHIYVQPGGEYELFVSDQSAYVDENAKSVDVEFFFLGLDSTDINYKILQYDNQQFEFLQANYRPKSLKSTNFVQKLDTFKLRITEEYKSDTSQFFKTYVKFSVASLDDLAFVGHRNEYEKFDFYIQPEPVWYQNDRYMSYILHYYKLYERQLSSKVNEGFYEAVINSSPSMAMNALGGDYSLKKIRLRELIMLNMLTEVFYTDDYPKTNILTMMDSLANYGLFEENKEIANNLKYRLLDLVPGTPMPNFALEVNGTKKYKNDYQGKHTYIQFINKDIQKSMNDLSLLYALQQKYAKNTQFVTVLVVDKEDELLTDATPFIKEHKIAWDFGVVKKDNPLLERLNVNTFPHYLLMDTRGTVLSAPALSPRPNNDYETIENILIQIDREYRLREEQR